MSHSCHCSLTCPLAYFPIEELQRKELQIYRIAIIQISSVCFLGERAMSIHPGLLGKYELQERLGQGGMAEVWKAFDQRLQRHVAIKFLRTSLQTDPTFITRFEREARAVASLRHPNIVQIYDFETSQPGVEDSLAYMVMDYIEGSTLADYLQATSHAQSFPSTAEIVSLMFSISEALDYAHQHGLLHRDIKPANILLDKRRTKRNPMGEPILSDFGIAKILGTTDGTLTSAVIGTPLYISPEQALGKPISAASDIYSLGIVLYEMCTGIRPFRGDTPFAIIQQHVVTPPPPPEHINPAISPALAAVIMRSLAKDPAARFPSAIAMTSALAKAVGVPLPERQRQLLSSPDIRGLPASSDQLPELPTHLLADLQPVAVKAARHGSYSPATPSPDPYTPAELTPSALSTLMTYAPAQPQAPKQVSPAEPNAPVRPVSSARRRRGLVIGLLLCLGIALLGSGMGTFFYLHSIHSGPTLSTAATSSIVGNGFFTSSGAAPGSQNLGLNDTFQVRLTGIPQPAAGTEYYAWLLPDQVQSEANPRALGTLVVNSGIASLPQPYVDPQNNNLIAEFSRFLVTQESTNPAPQSPSLDTKLWRYYAAIPQNPPVTDCQGMINQLSALCHLRHLLSGDPELALVHLQGGLNYWFLNNIKEVQKWATEGVDHSDPVDVRHKIVNILYMLDGRGCIAQDIQQRGNPGMDNTPDDGGLASIAAIPLLDCPWTPNITGYLAHIHNHLNAMIQAPGILSDQVTLASQIGTELNTLNEWLTELQNDARQLIAMDNTQLMQTKGQNLRNEIDTLATNVLSGGTDAGTGALVKGVASIADQIQQLANLDVMRYTAQ
jgi:eukaryotic-like serine/threonine-protein kinase